MGNKLTAFKAEEIRALIAELRDLVSSARQAVFRSIDRIEVLTNFEIGRRIVEY